jgi:hypothetical protein
MRAGKKWMAGPSPAMTADRSHVSEEEGGFAVRVTVALAA